MTKIEWKCTKNSLFPVISLYHAQASRQTQQWQLQAEFRVNQTLPFTVHCKWPLYYTPPLVSRPHSCVVVNLQGAPSQPTATKTNKQTKIAKHSHLLSFQLQLPRFATSRRSGAPCRRSSRRWRGRMWLQGMGSCGREWSSCPAARPPGQRQSRPPGCRHCPKLGLGRL